MTDSHDDLTATDATDQASEMEEGEEFEMPDEETLRTAQTYCAQWGGNFLRLLLEGPAELEVALYLTMTHLSRLHRMDQQPLPAPVALVRDTAAAIKARCWPVAPRVPKARASVLVFAGKIPVTLDAIFALALVEGAVRFAGAECEARLQADPHGPEAAALTAEMNRWKELLAGFVEETEATRKASGLPSMGMTPPEDRVPPPAPQPAAPPPADPQPDLPTL